MGIDVEDIPPFQIEMDESKEMKLNITTSSTTSLGLIPVTIKINSNIDLNASKEFTVYLDVQEGGFLSSASSAISSPYFPIVLSLIIVSALILVIKKKEDIKNISRYIIPRKFR
jgi:hypothetical protein